MSNNSKAQSLVQKLCGINRIFLFTVALPTLTAIIYFGVIASDVFISESRFVVRSPQRQAPAGLGALLQGAGFSRSQDDTYTVHDYILSRDALAQLDKQLKLSAAYSKTDIDLFSRFGSVITGRSFEEFYRYYQDLVSIKLDALSSISTLRIRAYSAEEAQRINERLLEQSEKLVNQLNERGRKDMISFAQAEVDAAEQRAKAASLAVSAYRTKSSVFDPERQSALQLQQVSKLQDELIATRMQLAQVLSTTPANPQVPALERRIKNLQADIDAEMAKVTGEGPSLSKKASEYERLALERAFADKQLATALASLEQARNDAQRKQLYLERIVQPSLPDQAMEPRRWRGVLSVFALGMVIWGVMSMLVAGIREHQD